eukprot:843646-Prymnesium_polylepis.1
MDSYLHKSGKGVRDSLELTKLRALCAPRGQLEMVQKRCIACPVAVTILWDLTGAAVEDHRMPLGRIALATATQIVAGQIQRRQTGRESVGRSLGKGAAVWDLALHRAAHLALIRDNLHVGQLVEHDLCLNLVGDAAHPKPQRSDHVQRHRRILWENAEHRAEPRVA